MSQRKYINLLVLLLVHVSYKSRQASFIIKPIQIVCGEFLAETKQKQNYMFLRGCHEPTIGTLSLVVCQLKAIQALWGVKWYSSFSSGHNFAECGHV